MKKLLKTMFNDIKPKSFKSFFEGIAIIILLFAVLLVTTAVFGGIAIGIALLLALPLDIVVLGMLAIISLTIWVLDANERTL